MAEPGRKRWSSRGSFLLATTGAAVGLGNVWRFPFLVGENGGAAFVLVYLAFAFLIGVPVITAELALGRMGHQSPIGSVKTIIREQGAHAGWQAIGVISLLVPFLGFTYYSIVAGWSLYYTVEAARNAFDSMGATDSQRLFQDLAASPWLTVFLQGVVIGLTAVVVGSGLHRGIERATKVMMPSLVFIMLIMIVYNVFAADVTAALAFLFTPDFSQLTSTSRSLGSPRGVRDRRSRYSHRITGWPCDLSNSLRLKSESSRGSRARVCHDASCLRRNGFGTCNRCAVLPATVTRSLHNDARHARADRVVPGGTVADFTAYTGRGGRRFNLDSRLPSRVVRQRVGRY